MHLRKFFLSISVCLLASAAALQANNVFVLPDGITSEVVNVFSGDPMAFAGSFNGPAGAGLDSLASPDSPVTYWTYGAATGGTVVAVDRNLTELFRSTASLADGRAGLITPDGLRMLVVADTLRMFDAATLTEIFPNPALDVGQDPVDVAAGLDSRYAYVLSAGDNRLTRVDLLTNTVAGTLVIPGLPMGVSAGADCLIYVSTSNEIRVIDGSTMTHLRSINLNGFPAKVYFTPDGLMGIAVNTNTNTGSSGWVFDLTDHSVAATLPVLQVGLNRIRMENKVIVASNERVFLIGIQNHVIYELEVSPGINLDALTVGGVGVPLGVLGAAVSNEMPNARFLYYATADTLHRVDLATNQLSGNTAEIPGNVARLAYARQPSSDAAVAFMRFHDGQVIAPGGEFRPIVIRALDVIGRPVYNLDVEFATAVPGVQIENASATTNLEGLAKAYVNPGEVEGPIPVTVTIGIGLVANFNLTVGAAGGGGGVGGIFRLSGNGQLLSSQQVAVKPLRVIVRDEFGVGKPSAQVTWAVTQGSVQLFNTVSTTDGFGEAQTTFLGGIVPIFFSYEQSIVTATSGGSSVDFVMTMYPLMNLRGQPVSSPVARLITPAGGIAALVGDSGTTLPAAIQVKVFAGAGQDMGAPIPNVAITATTGVLDPGAGPITNCVGVEPLTDVDGLATCDLMLAGIGTAQLTVNVGSFLAQRPLLVTVNPGPPGIVNILGGNNQEGEPGVLLPLALVAEVTDASGNLLPGAQGQWEVLDQGAVTLSNVVSVADANGRVSANATLGTTPGEVSVRFTSGAGTATFTLTVSVVVTQLVMVSGNNQVAITNEQFTQPLTVRLNDENGAGVPGFDIGFAVSSGVATLGTTNVTTDAQGRASVLVTAGATPGDIVVAAVFAGLPQVSFNLTSRAPGPVVTAASFFNGASGAPGVVPGSVVNIIAGGLAPDVQNCAVAPSLIGALPMQLAGVTVQFGPDTAPLFAPIFHVCNINGEESAAVQAPFGLAPGFTEVTIRVGTGSTRVQNVQVLTVQPGIFETIGVNSLPHAVVLRPDRSYVSPQNPVLRGETACMFATGLGAVNPPAATNSTGIVGQQVLVPLVVGVNNEGVRVVRANYAVNMIGIYEVCFEVPLDATTGPARPFALAIQDNGTLVFANGSSIAVGQ